MLFLPRTIYVQGNGCSPLSYHCSRKPVARVLPGRTGARAHELELEYEVEVRVPSHLGAEVVACVVVELMEGYPLVMAWVRR